MGLLSKLSRPKRGLEGAEALYQKGRHADAAAAFRILAADKNDRQAQWRLGQLYERGEGVLQSFVDAAQWFRLAAAQGCVPAMAGNTTSPGWPPPGPQPPPP